MDQDSLKKLRRALPLNASKMIAERTNKSKSLVDKVLCGYRRNQMIIDEAINLAEEQKKVQNIRSKKIHDLSER